MIFIMWPCKCTIDEIVSQTTTTFNTFSDSNYYEDVNRAWSYIGAAALLPLEDHIDDPTQDYSTRLERPRERSNNW